MAIGTGAAILGGAIAGSLIQGQAASSAADAQAQAANQQAALQERMFNKQNELNEPFRQGGLAAQNKLLELLGIGGNKAAQGYGDLARTFAMSDFQQDPGYAFRLSEGLKALDRTAAARGGLLSGSTLKGAQRYAEDLASQEYQNAFNRYQVNRANQLNPLQSLMGSGQSAVNALSNAAQNYAHSAGESYANVGNTRASGYIGRANALTGAIGQLGNYYQQQALINSMTNPASGLGGYGSQGGSSSVAPDSYLA